MFYKKNTSLNKLYFSRNRHRESEDQDIFNIAYRSLSFITNTVFPIIFTPIVVITNAVSHSILFNLLNFFLALGYGTQFLNRMILKEVEFPELFISLSMITMFAAVSFYSFPLSGALTLLNTLNVVNILSISINSFFLVRNYILPPLQAFIKQTLHFFNIEVSTTFFNIEKFSLEKDRPVLDRLLKKFYGHDSFAVDFKKDEITVFNKLLDKLVIYINRYNEPFLGALNNQDKINHLTKALDQLMIDGNTDSSIAFIRKKLDFKISKVKLLEQAVQVTQEEQTKKVPDISHLYRFFSHIEKDNEKISIEQGLSSLQQELARQKNKIADLELCLPQASRLAL